MKSKAKWKIGISLGVFAVIVIIAVTVLITERMEQQSKMRQRWDYVTKYFQARSLLEEAGDYEGAINKLSQLLKNNPKVHNDAYFYRGIAYFFDGNYESSANDFDYQIKLMYDYCNSEDDTEYCSSVLFSYVLAHIWKFLALKHLNLHDGNLKAVSLDENFSALKHNGSNDIETLKTHAQKLNENWVAPTVRMFLNEILPETCLNELVHKNIKSGGKQKCLAYFYVGQYYMIHHDRQKAFDCFENCIETKDTSSFIEFHGAKAEIKRFLNESE